MSSQFRAQLLDQQRRSLPVFNYKQKILAMVERHQIIILRGETGSGKSTQIPQYLLEEGYARNGRIGCTQPRRAAAKYLARRVAEEHGCQLGKEVGYQVRLEKVCDDDTHIKYMTDGVFILECLKEDDLHDYSVIMLDEVHERSLNTDVIFGLVKKILPKRPDLKLIVTSATMNAGEFSKYFLNAPTVEIPGRSYQVEIHHEQFDNHIKNMVKTVADKVLLVHMTKGPGDILAFLTGKEEIEEAAEILERDLRITGHPTLMPKIIQFCRGTSPEEQERLTDKPSDTERKIILATNIAETSITIEGIVFVVDGGFVKQKQYNPRSKLDSLVSVRISQAQAEQRAGRAGRTQNGHCYRLYTRSTYERLLPTAVPEILRVQLSYVVLILKSIQIRDVIRFDLMEKPPRDGVEHAEEVLRQLEALDHFGYITETGRKMLEIPLEPQLSRVLIKSVELGCAKEMAKIVAVLSSNAQNLYFRPRNKQKNADFAKHQLNQPEGDLLTILEVFNRWFRNNCSKIWSRDNFINQAVLEEALPIQLQLEAILRKKGFEVISCNGDKSLIQKAVVSGFYMNRARLVQKIGKKNLFRRDTDNEQMYISPKSSLFLSPPNWVVYQDTHVTNNGNQMFNATSVQQEWLAPYLRN